MARTKTILCVDDEPNILRLIQINVERAGYQVETANNGAVALAKIRESRPDLVVTDVMMPEMDGFELLASIRRDPALMDLPVILLVAKAADRDVLMGYRSGADMFLTTPFNPVELIAAVRRLLGDDDRGGGGSGPVGAPILPFPPSRPARDARPPPPPKRKKWWEA